LIEDLLENDEDLEIPDSFPISEQLLKDFNERNFNPGNINDILSLCDYLLIVNTEYYILRNMEPSNTEYILNDYHKTHYKLPSMIYESMLLNDMIKYGVMKYIIALKKKLGIKFVWNTMSCYTASKYGHLDILILAHNNGAYLSSNICTTASSNGHLDCLIWAHENGYEIDIYASVEASKNGHLDCLMYAIENNCQFHLQICGYAGEQGHLDCLKYLRQNGGPWQKNTLEYIGHGGHLDCLIWAHENGCPKIDNLCKHIVGGGNLECLIWALNIGYSSFEFVGCHVSNIEQLICHHYMHDYRNKS
jgi:hypothetical protein